MRTDTGGRGPVAAWDHCSLIRRAVQQGSGATMTARGGSMAPTIVSGDRVRIVRCDFADVAPGQVIAFEVPGRIVTHRVLDRYEGQLVTAGDAHWFTDAPVTEQSYLGVVADVDPRPPLRRWSAGPARAASPMPPGGRTDVVPWIFTDRPEQLPDTLAGARTVPLSGIGSRPDRLAEFSRGLAAFDLVVLLHSGAVRPLDSLREIDWSRVGSVAVLVGGRIGEGAAGTDDFIPSALADVKVRVRGVGEAVPADEAIAGVRQLLGRT
ncbi:S24/S26 family peptidase [Streptacidiphilus albus]|uniref:S24/S26 family peptidase n=1 Tax=Streptacidiphilus albus TaxID=105425 RepID=UPI0009DE6A1C|nr:S24/S26 family peptidase [Streptacidiphilus albus]